MSLSRGRWDIFVHGRTFAPLTFRTYRNCPGGAAEIEILPRHAERSVVDSTGTGV